MVFIRRCYSQEKEIIKTTSKFPPHILLLLYTLNNRIEKSSFSVSTTFTRGTNEIFTMAQTWFMLKLHVFYIMIIYLYIIFSWALKMSVIVLLVYRNIVSSVVFFWTSILRHRFVRIIFFFFIHIMMSIWKNEKKNIIITANSYQIIRMTSSVSDVGKCVWCVYMWSCLPVAMSRLGRFIFIDFHRE